MIHILMAVGAAALWAGSIVGVKELSSVLQAPVIAFLRFALALVCLLPFFSLRDYKKISRKHMPLFGGMGASMLAVFVLTVIALQHASLTTFAIIVMSHPLAIMLASAILERKMPARNHIIAMALAFGGIGFAVTKGGAMAMGYGEQMALAAMACQVVYVLIMQRLNNAYSPAMTMLMMSAWGAVLVAPFLINMGVIETLQVLSWEHWAMVAGVGVLGTAGAFTLYAHVISKLGASKASQIVLCGSLLLIATAAHFVLAQPIMMEQIVGGVLVMAGLLLGLC